MQSQHHHGVKDDDIRSSSTFKWRIENISKLSIESRFSPIFTIGPHQWRLLAFQKGSNVDGYLSLNLIAVDFEISRYVKFSLAIAGQTNTNTFKKKDQAFRFTEDETDFCFEDFVQLQELRNPSNGYITDDACTVEVELCLNSNTKEELVPIALMDNNTAFRCAFCQTFKVSESSGSMLHIANGKEVDEVSGPNVIHVHRKCLEWTPQVYHDGDTIVNLEMEVERGSKLKCSCCGLKGAALGCYVRSCQNTYHFPCASGTPDCRWDDEVYLMLCPSHFGMKFPRERTKKGKKLANEKSVAVQRASTASTLPSLPKRKQPIQQPKRKRQLITEEEEK